MSYLSCGFCDKYDTHCCNANLFMNKTYPSKALSQASTASEPLQTDADDPEVEAVGVPEGRAYGASMSAGEPNEVHLHADIAGGLPGYARNAWGLARAAAREANAAGVITFARPLTWEEFRAVEATGVLVDTIEAVSHPDATGLRWSFVARSDANTPEGITMAADDADVEVLGIVSATVTVPNVKVLKALEAMESVYLVDLSIADFKRHNPGVTDVTQNDVYWHLAGWD